MKRQLFFFVLMVSLIQGFWVQGDDEAWQDISMVDFVLSQQDGGDLPVIQGRRFFLWGIDTDGNNTGSDYAESTAEAQGPFKGVKATLCMTKGSIFHPPDAVVQIEFAAQLSDDSEIVIEITSPGIGAFEVEIIGTQLHFKDGFGQVETRDIARGVAITSFFSRVSAFTPSMRAMPSSLRLFPPIAWT